MASASVRPSSSRKSYYQAVISRKVSESLKKAYENGIRSAGVGLGRDRFDDDSGRLEESIEGFEATGDASFGVSTSDQDSDYDDSEGSEGDGTDLSCVSSSQLSGSDSNGSEGFEEDSNWIHFETDAIREAQGDFTNYGNKSGEVPQDLNGDDMSPDELYGWQSAYEFKIAPLIERALRKMKEAEECTPSDAEESLSGEGCAITKGVFAETLRLFFDANAVPVTTREGLLDLLSHSMGSMANLPFAAATSKVEGSSRSLHKQLSAYCAKTRCADLAHFRFAQCAHGCAVFVGAHSAGWKCPECGSNRYTNCTHPTCKQKVGHQTPEEIEEQCTHSKRTPIRVVHYRSILCLLRMLLRTELFLWVLRCQYVTPTSYTSDAHAQGSSPAYYDIKDGETAKENMKQMHCRFQEHKASREGGGSCQEVSLLLAHFFDGLSLFRYKTVNFWPLLVQILNLPPTFRSKLGIGIFNVGLYSGESGKKAEEFLLKECFLQELQMLQKGIELVVGSDTFFVQARVIAHQMDTKAYEKVMRCQSTSTSLQGCPMCTSCCGRTHPGVGMRTFFNGHRLNLPHDHVLRVLGAGRKTCVPFEGSVHITPFLPQAREAERKAFAEYRAPLEGEELEEFAKSAAMEPKVVQFDNLARARSHFVDASKPEGLYAQPEKLGNMYWDWQGGAEWFHDRTKFDRTLFFPFLYYEKCELRAPIPHVRRTNRWYVKCALAAEAMLADSTHGISGLWWAHRLSYARYEDTYWCTMHVIKNVYSSIISTLTGHRMATNKTLGRETFVKYCMMKSMFPTFVQTTTLPAWQIDVQCQRRVDAFMNAMLLPRGFGNAVQVKDVFQHHERTMSHACKVLLLGLLPYLLDQTRLEGTYKGFYTMLSEDLADLFRPNVEASEVQGLHDRLMETVAIHDGLFPPYECTFAWHQLTDLAKMITQLGPLEGWTGFWGERYLSTVKRLCPRGGGAFDSTIVERLHRMEQAVMTAVYNCPSALDSEEVRRKRAAAFDSSFLSSSDTGLLYSLHQHRLGRRVSQSDSQRIGVEGPLSTEGDDEYFLRFCLHHIRVVYPNEEDALARSGLYRIFYAFKEYHRHQKEYEFDGFALFLFELETMKTKKVLLRSEFRPYIWSRSGRSDFQPGAEGHLLLSDIMELWKHPPRVVDLMSFHTSCSVYGIPFRSRGYASRERGHPPVDTEEPRSTRRRARRTSTGCAAMNVPANLLYLKWNDSSVASSWCKYRAQWSDVEGRPSVAYALINCFHAIHMPHEVALHGTIVASITTFVHEYRRNAATGMLNSYATVPCTRGVANLDARCPRFIASTAIVPTPLGVVGLVEERASAGGGLPKPWADLKKVRKAGANVTQCFADALSSDVDFLHLIDLSPQNNGIAADRLMRRFYLHS